MKDERAGGDHGSPPAFYVGSTQGNRNRGAMDWAAGK